jgi:predicted amino acid-binding ACT domain protein
MLLKGFLVETGMVENLSEIIVIAVGMDKPGLVSEVSNVIFELNGNIEDMDQVVMRNVFIMSVFARFDNPHFSVEKLKNILSERCGKVGLKVEVYSVKELSGGV